MYGMSLDTECVSDRVQVLFDALTERHSCRAFKNEMVPRPRIRQLLELAQRTASWCNTQPWRVHLLSGASLDQLRDAYTSEVGSSPGDTDFEFPVAYRGVYQDRRRTCGHALYSSLGIDRGNKSATQSQLMENYRFFGAPHLAIITTEADLGDYGAIDCGGYISTFLFAAQLLGIGAVPQAAIATHSSFLRAHLGLTDNRKVVAGISFGFEDTSHPANAFRTERASVDDTVVWLD